MVRIPIAFNFNKNIPSLPNDFTVRADKNKSIGMDLKYTYKFVVEAGGLNAVVLTETRATGAWSVATGMPAQAHILDKRVNSASISAELN